MSKLWAIIIGAVLLIALLLYSMTYTVSFHEVAIKTRFGRADDQSIIREAGLKMRLPFFADRVTKYDTRLQLRETPLETIMTSDGLQVVVRAFLLWKVETEGNGPLVFSSNFSTIDDADGSLLDQFRNALNSGVSRFNFDDLVGPKSRLDDAEQAIKKEMMSITSKGIRPVSVGISQLQLPAKTSTAVLKRMQATRTTLSENERFKGNAEAEGIKARASAMADKIKAFANLRAEEIRQAGNDKAAQYLKEMSKNEELAVFLAWLDALQNALSENTTVVIPTLFAPFHMMQLDGHPMVNGIPQPSGEMGPTLKADAPKTENNIEQRQPSSLSSAKEKP
jgi:regulator of protease activity HflC (stomatin/prohibitin superfamily)